eukprot:1233142-Rhodomonas_salina.1
MLTKKPSSSESSPSPSSSSPFAIHVAAPVKTPRGDCPPTPAPASPAPSHLSAPDTAPAARLLSNVLARTAAAWCQHVLCQRRKSNARAEHIPGKRFLGCSAPRTRKPPTQPTRPENTFSVRNQR